MSKGYSTTLVSVLCIISFFAGRFLQIPGLPEAGRGPTVHRDSGSTAHRKGLEVPEPVELNTLHTGNNARNAIKSIAEHHQGGGFTSFEELLEVSGMLADHPPLQSGISGHDFYTMQPMQLISWYPRAYLFPKFMDKERCEHVRRIAEARLAPSGLALKQGETLESTREIRTSQGTFMSRDMDPDGVLAWMEDKIAVLTGIPAGHGEAFNILRYENGQHYDSHYDAFVEEDYGKQYSHRVATVLVYLTDVEEGGETSFLFEGKDGLQRLSTVDYKRCNTGIKVRPRAGDALLFWSAHPNGEVDKHSLHGGCPVIAGTKWTATKWIRDKCSDTRGTCVGPDIGFKP